jgi:hypothetical protein
MRRHPGAKAISDASTRHAPSVLLYREAGVIDKVKRPKRSESPQPIQFGAISIRGGRKGDHFAQRASLFVAQWMVQQVLHEQPLMQGLEIVGEARARQFRCTGARKASPVSAGVWTGSNPTPGLSA